MAVLLVIAIKLSAPITQFYWGVMGFTILGFGIFFFLGPLLLLGIFHRHCRHHKWRFIIGAVAVNGMLITTVVFDPFDKIGGSVAQIIVGALIAIPIAGTIGGLLNMGLAALKDLLGERPKIQDGTLCPTCGYTIVGLPEPRCPECGNQFTPHDLEASPPSGKRQWRRVGLAWLATLFLLLGAYLAGPYVLIRACADGWLKFVPALDYLRINPELSERLLCDSLETGDDTERILSASQLGFLLIQWPEQWPYDDRTITLLVHAAMEDPVVMVRQMAIQSLSMLSSEGLYDVLPRAVRDDSADVRWTALAGASGGGILPNPRGTPFLIEALDDADQTVRTRVYARLKANTGQTFPFNPTAPIEQCRAQQEKWQQWWEGQQ
ncbi:MAG: HEAT repeat domain-containing protein [Planctomycetota bacterium]|nr:HEAT repeat domain-containing protein [Planctomycetota bacterium]